MFRKSTLIIPVMLVFFALNETAHATTYYWITKPEAVPFTVTDKPARLSYNISASLEAQVAIEFDDNIGKFSIWGYSHGISSCQTNNCPDYLYQAFGFWGATPEQTIPDPMGNYPPFDIDTGIFTSFYQYFIMRDSFGRPDVQNLGVHFFEDKLVQNSDLSYEGVFLFRGMKPNTDGSFVDLYFSTGAPLQLDFLGTSRPNEILSLMETVPEPTSILLLASAVPLLGKIRSRTGKLEKK